MNLTPIIKESFLQFGGAVLQSRALPDVRDLLKPSARQIFYCMHTDGFIHSKPFQKTLKSIGSCFRLYIHGDASAEGVIMRAGQPFAMRYPLVEVEGSYGSLLSSGNWSAPRYTSSRLSALSDYLFNDIKKEVISEWRDNYDDTEKYPTVLPTKGFYNLVNGAYGIGVGMSTSIPQYNIVELNAALVKLLWNKDIEFDEIYCAPDFATGAILLNADEVKESHCNGGGKACKLRSVIEWDNNDKCFVVKELPYMVYTETICHQLEEIIESEDNPGILRFNDLTGTTPLIKIYLNRGANKEKVLNYLYKNTSLQNHYNINFTMLENGRFPKVFTWKEMLQAHIDHEIEIYTRGFQYDLRKIEARLHVIEGLLKAISIIDQVIATIKGAKDTKTANLELQKQYKFTEIQAKAILDIKLSRLAHLELAKLQSEKENLIIEKNRITATLENESLLKKEIEKGFQEVSKKFGDARRTQILNIGCADNDEVDEIKSYNIGLSNLNNLYVTETSTLFTQSKRSVGNKYKLKKGEYITHSFAADSNDTIFFFTESGNLCNAPVNRIIDADGGAVEQFITLEEDEKICFVCNSSKVPKKYLVIVTKNGILKKSSINEYRNLKRKQIKAIKLDDNDKICSVFLTDGENEVAFLTRRGQFVRIEINTVKAIGRATKGVKGISLNDGDSVVSVHEIPKGARKVVTISENGQIKLTKLDEFSRTGRGTKGTKIQSLREGDKMVAFLVLNDESKVVVMSNAAQLKIDLNFGVTARGALGVSSIKLKPKEKVIGILSD